MIALWRACGNRAGRQECSLVTNWLRTVDKKLTIQRISLGLTLSFRSLLAMKCGCMVLKAEEKSRYIYTCVTCSHEMSLNLKFGNLRYLHVSNLQVLLVILIFKSHFYFKKMWMWCVFEGCMCGGGHFEKISFKVFHCALSSFSLILSNRRFKCTNLYQFCHRNISNIGAPEETLNFNIS